MISESVLRTMIKRFRLAADEPETMAKYDNSTLVNEVFGESMANVIGRLAMDSDSVVVATATLTVVEGTEDYALPNAVRTILGIREESTRKFLRDETLPRSFGAATHERGWRIEGNTLRFHPQPTRGEEYTLYYVPTGLGRMHYATDGELTGTGTQDARLVLSASPTFGQLETVEGALVGTCVRLIGGGGRPTEELVVASHTWNEDDDQWEVTFRSPPLRTANGTVTYEVVPQFLESIIEAVVYDAAMAVGTSRDWSPTKMGYARMRYQSAIKTVTDRWANMEGRKGKQWGKGLDRQLINVLPAFGQRGLT